MKKLLFLGCLLLGFCKALSAQVPEVYIGTWYLEYFTMPDVQGDVFVNTLDITEGPSFTLYADGRMDGVTFCNVFSGFFEFDPNGDPINENSTITPFDISMETNDCGDSEAYESRLFPAFVNGEDGRVLAVDNGDLVLQFPSSGYQAYRSFPVLTIDENNVSSSVISPNPASETLAIFNNIIPLKEAMVIDLQGKTIKTFSEGFENIDISNLSNGVYFLKITSENAQTIKRFIKK